MNLFMESVLGFNAFANERLDNLPEATVDLPNETDYMDDVIEPLEFNNGNGSHSAETVHIDGVAYQLSTYGPPHEIDGSRYATLRVWKPF